MLVVVNLSLTMNSNFCITILYMENHKSLATSTTSPKKSIQVGLLTHDGIVTIDKDRDRRCGGGLPLSATDKKMGIHS